MPLANTVSILAESSICRDAPAWIKYGATSPKFIWAPCHCAQLYSLAETPPATPAIQPHPWDSYTRALLVRRRPNRDVSPPACRCRMPSVTLHITNTHKHCIGAAPPPLAGQPLPPLHPYATFPTSNYLSLPCLYTHELVYWTNKWHIERKQDNAPYSMYHPAQGGGIHGGALRAERGTSSG
jgi:hypothetical protein